MLNIMALSANIWAMASMSMVLPRHSWNSSHIASNWFLINLQRHSDHHYKPDRRYPLLQTYSADEAPALPFGYPVVAALGLDTSRLVSDDEPARAKMARDVLP